MGSILSTLKSPSSIFTGGDGDDVGVWSETAAAHVLRMDLPWLKKNDSVTATVVECGGYMMKLMISGEVTTVWKKFPFTKLVKLPENCGVMFRHAAVVVHDGFFIVTLPKVEEV